MRKYRKLINFFLVVTSFVLPIFAFNSEAQTKNELKFIGLSEQERVERFTQIKQEFVNNLICSEFKNEINNYQIDFERSELKKEWVYFVDYPHHFKRMKLRYNTTLTELLERKGVERTHASIKNMDVPSIESLPCQDEIVEWQQIRIEWNQIKSVMPSSYFYEDSWSYKLEKTIEWIKDLVSDIFYVLLYIAAFVFAFALHHSLIIKKNREGLWLIAVTPFIALPLLTKFKNMIPIEVEKWEAWLLATLLISFIFTVILLLYSRLLRNGQHDLDD
jgi:hypothetical protein